MSEDTCDEYTDGTGRDTRWHKVEKDGLKLEAEVRGECTECDEKLVESDISPDLVCPDCGASYSAVHKILSVNRSVETDTE